MTMKLSHLDEQGKARMVDVSGKPRVLRTARATGTVRMAAETVRLIRENQLQKGDALAVARIAGITGAKKTSELIPLCHGIRVDQVTVDLTLGEGRVEIESRVICTESTGVEMEALVAVSIAALTLYDMCKAVDKGMTIEAVRLLEKTKEEPSP
ncbi:MAG TPA: cyclic pyranopterin monophosphate synthase MoaC [Spirochaetia bacterium]|nr:cyclic pyranopterin monophosphate synthase MoaC [Spirochaetia bacterium]